MMKTLFASTMKFSSSVLEIELSDHVATLWLNRPDKLNAISMGMWQDLPIAMNALAENDEVRTVIIAGRGKSFCVGIDLQSLTSQADLSTATGCLEQQRATKICQDAITAVADCPLPVIAAIHSHCLGAGVDLATACDIRLASSDAVFGVRETKIGIVADVGTLQRLPAIIGAGHVAELCYTGKDISAERALEIGLINHRFDDIDALQTGAQAMAQEIAANAPLAVRGTKLMLQQGENLSTEQSLLLNGAMMAFMQKRKPNFTGS